MVSMTPDELRCLRTLKIQIYLTPKVYDALRYRAIRHASSVEGYIKRVLNKQIRANKLPEPEAFIRHWPITKSPQPEHVGIRSSYVPFHLAYLDRLAENIPAHYGTGAKTRRRLIETLVLIDLFDTGD